MIPQNKTKDLEEKIIDILFEYPFQPPMKGTEDGMNEITVMKLVELFSLTEQRVAKAYGGCEKCYGKGYATTIEYAQSCIDFGNEKEERWKLPEVRFCSCDRGKQLRKYFAEAEQRVRKEGIIEGIKMVNLPEYDHRECSIPKTCIGYQSAESDLDNIKEGLISSLTKE